MVEGKTVSVVDVVLGVLACMWRQVKWLGNVPWESFLLHHQYILWVAGLALSSWLTKPTWEIKQKTNTHKYKQHPSVYISVLFESASVCYYQFHKMSLLDIRGPCTQRGCHSISRYTTNWVSEPQFCSYHPSTISCFGKPLTSIYCY